MVLAVSAEVNEEGTLQQRLVVAGRTLCATDLSTPAGRLRCLSIVKCLGPNGPANGPVVLRLLGCHGSNSAQL